MPIPNLPPWLDPASPQDGTLDPTSPQQARFILSVAADERLAGHFTDAEIETARQTLPLTALIFYGGKPSPASDPADEYGSEVP